MHALRLKAGGRVRTLFLAIEAVAVAGTGRDARHHRAMVAARVPLHRHRAQLRRGDNDLDTGGKGGPDTKMALTVAKIGCAQALGVLHRSSFVLPHRTPTPDYRYWVRRASIAGITPPSSPPNSPYARVIDSV